VLDLLLDQPRLVSMGAAASSFGSRDADDALADLVLKAVGG
jgi:UDP-N-acetylglucosamine:LPS N-acetylglucosamine transferase